MIRVNLSGAPRKRSGKGSTSRAPVPSRALPLFMILLVVATAAGGFWWYTALTAQIDDLTAQQAQLEIQKAKLASIIKQDQIFETRKKALETRIRIIEGLKRGQVSPVRSLDMLDDAIDKTQYVWLSNLEQNNAIFTLSGTGTSVNAIADFLFNLEATGYFRNLELKNAQDASGNFTFNLTCEFAPPAVQAAPEKGAN